MTAWSYSTIKTFDQCPKKFFHLSVAKDFKDEPGAEMDYGNKVHKVAELYIKDGTPIPEQFAYMRPIMEPLAAAPGAKHTEMKLGVAKTDTGFAPCGFFDKNVWWRGIVDLAIINGPKARMLDYKTGKATRADTKQLDLMAGAIFVHFPEVEEVKGALAFVVANEFVPKTHTREHLAKYMGVFDAQLDRLEAAKESGVWNANPGPLCSWCPVSSCEHWRPRR
jgi:hypothetical protein